MQSLETSRNGISRIPNGWNQLKIDQLTNNKDDIKTGPFGSTLKKEIFVPKGYKIYGQENVIPDDFSIGDYFIPHDIFLKMRKYEVRPGDLLISLVGTQGRVSLVPNNIQKGIINPRLLRIRVDTKKVLPLYMKILLNSNIVNTQTKKLSHGLTMDILNTQTIKKLVFPIPPIEEQQIIAYILSKIDEYIQKTDQIIEQTQQLKKGLMQKLLTKGIGHTKFKKVDWYFGKSKQIPDPWNFVQLDKVAVRGTGHTPNAKEPAYYNGGIKWVSLADSYRLDNLYISETTKEISQLGIENSSAVKHPPGTVIMSRDAGVGKSAITKSEMAVSQHFVTWKCGQNLDNQYLYYLLQSWKSLFESAAIGTTIKTIGLPFFKKLTIPLPPIREQTRIVRILMNIDFFTMKEIKYCSELKLLKKGLMQRLLTGKIRVKL